MQSGYITDTTFTPLERPDVEGPYIFAVGDLNGRYDLLDDMVSQIEKFPLAKNDKIIFLGNYSGQKGNTFETMRRLRKYKEARPDNVILLRGEADHKFLRFDKDFTKSILGEDVVRSYRFPPNVTVSPKDSNRLAAVSLTLDRKFIMTNTQFSYSTQELFFVSSGVADTPTLELQNPMVYMFSRFQDKEDKQYSKLVVHGNALVKRGKMDTTLLNRVCVDTGSSFIAHNALSCAVFRAKSGVMKHVLRAETGFPEIKVPYAS